MIAFSYPRRLRVGWSRLQTVVCSSYPVHLDHKAQQALAILSPRTDLAYRKELTVFFVRRLIDAEHSLDSLNPYSCSLLCHLVLPVLAPCWPVKSAGNVGGPNGEGSGSTTVHVQVTHETTRKSPPIHGSWVTWVDACMLIGISFVPLKLPRVTSLIISNHKAIIHRDNAVCSSKRKGVSGNNDPNAPALLKGIPCHLAVPMDWCCLNKFYQHCRLALHICPPAELTV
jgi:hypothetical protein